MVSIIKEDVMLVWLVVYCGIFIIQVKGQSFDLTYSIDEEVPINTVVGNVGRDSKIYQLLSSEDYDTLRYRILVYPDSHNNFFSIVNTTGVLKTASLIDRELICFYETKCKLNLHVAAQTESGQQFYTFKITVNVQDINDNSPTFSMSTMNVKIDEDAALSTSIPIMSATDRDILNNTIQRYTLVANSDIFGLKVSRNLDDSLTPQLYVKSAMDRERQPHYFIKVLALDGGIPRRSGELTINVTLNDVNDNTPRFSKQTYDESVAEISPIGHRVMTLSATDEDLGNNGRVTFRLGARQSEEAFNTFRVVANTGDILTLRDLTPLQGQTLRLVVEAVDQGVKSQTAQAVVNIHIIDTVNNAPIIRMTIPPGSPVSRISESASPGFVVAHFLVDDADSGENGVVSCKLPSDTFNLQKLKDSEYKVTVYSTLDRERIPFYEVTITCVDNGIVPLTSTVAFTVILEDANDNPPQFLKSVYKANISENLSTFILRVEAEDIDLGQNGTVNYKLGDVTPLVASYIQINPISGEINTKQMLDRELSKQLDFPVVAYDSGTPSQSSTVRVVIDVMDQNDNIPRVPNGYFLSVPENSPAGTYIGHIKAVDPDDGLGGQVGYQLRTDNGATNLFNLSQTGELRTLQVFDRETKPIYDIDVLAWDYGKNPQTNDLRVRIVVADVNDHAPVIEFPKNSNKTVYTTLDLRYNSTVTYVIATDQDAGENASLTYTIEEGGRDTFEVDPQTGRIFAIKSLYSKDKGTYHISLLVRDNGAQRLSTTGSLDVVVTQGNGTAAMVSFGTNEHIIIIAILVGITIFIAITVFLIVIRFLKKDKRHRRTKYTGGLPMEAKVRTGLTEDQSSDDEPWSRYDAAKRPNGPVRSGDAVYEVNDDIILFKLKLADEYKELEPEDKEHSCCMANDDDSDNRNSVHSDMDGLSEIPRMTRVATYHGRPNYCSDQKEKVWRSAFKDKMGDEILSTGADSGRGPSEDGSSVTDDSGCLISPSHSSQRGTQHKYQVNYSRPPSGNGYDRPPFLMTFQTMSPDRQDHSPSSHYPPGHSPRKGHGKDYSMRASSDRLHVVERDIKLHKSNPDLSEDHKHAALKKMFSAGTCSAIKRENSKGNLRAANGVVMVGDRVVGTPGKAQDIRLCSEPPSSGDKTAVAYNGRCVQESGMATPAAHLSAQAMHVNIGRCVYVDAIVDRSPGGKTRFIYPPSNYLQTCPNPSSYKQASCPQLFEDAIYCDYDYESQVQLPAPNRSRSFHNHNHEKSREAPSRSTHDIPQEIHEMQDDGNTTTTSGSYTIDHEELILEMPQTDVFV